MQKSNYIGVVIADSDVDQQQIVNVESDIEGKTPLFQIYIGMWT